MCSPSSDTLRPRASETTAGNDVTDGGRYRRPTDHVTGDDVMPSPTATASRTSSCKADFYVVVGGVVVSGTQWTRDAVFNRIERRHKLIEID